MLDGLTDAWNAAENLSAKKMKVSVGLIRK
jgi:hypothetical protein